MITIEDLIVHVEQAPIDPDGMPSPEEEGAPGLNEAVLEEHLAGHHNQKAHAGGRAGGVSGHVASRGPKTQAAIAKRAEELGLDAGAVEQRLQELYTGASPEIRQAGMDWYGEVHNAALAAGKPYGMSIEQTAGVYAVVSPGRSWASNRRVGDAVIDVVGRNEPFVVGAAKAGSARPPFPPGTYKPSELKASQLAWAHPALTGVGGASLNHYRQVSDGIELARGTRTPDMVLTGPKTRSFYNNIYDPTNPSHVTIDDWMYRSMLGPSFSVSTKTGTTTLGQMGYGGAGQLMTRSPRVASEGHTTGMYSWFADRITTVSAQYGILPQQLQAVTWSAARGTHE